MNKKFFIKHVLMKSTKFKIINWSFLKILPCDRSIICCASMTINRTKCNRPWFNLDQGDLSCTGRVIYLRSKWMGWKNICDDYIGLLKPYYMSKCMIYFFLVFQDVQLKIYCVLFSLFWCGLHHRFKFQKKKITAMNFQ